MPAQVKIVMFWFYSVYLNNLTRAIYAALFFPSFNFKISTKKVVTIAMFLLPVMSVWRMVWRNDIETTLYLNSLSLKFEQFPVISRITNFMEDWSNLKVSFLFPLFP